MITIKHFFTAPNKSKHLWRFDTFTDISNVLALMNQLADEYIDEDLKSSDVTDLEKFAGWIQNDSDALKVFAGGFVEELQEMEDDVLPPEDFGLDPSNMEDVFEFWQDENLVATVTDPMDE
jgi:hypothetical protein